MMPTLNKLSLRIGGYATIGVVVVFVLLQTAYENRSNRARDAASVADRAILHAELRRASEQRAGMLRRIEALEVLVERAALRGD